VADEDQKDRLDRELLELLNELRVAIPGIQVLFAFLLTVPFTQQFAKVSQFQEDVYFVTLLLACLASAFLIAPSAYHRIQFRQQDKRQMLETSNRLAIVGLGLLALAMTSTVLLITDLLFTTTTVIVVTGLIGLTFAGLWYALPLSRRARSD
jgi:membrane-bound acyltransferase YfiQ involved in biofilm formation